MFFELEAKLLKIIGFSMHSDKSLLYKMYSYLIICIVASSSYCTLYSIFTDVENTIVLLENFTMGATLLIASARVVIGYYIRSDLEKHLKVLKGDQFFPNANKYGGKETKIINEYLKKTKIQTIMFCTTPCIYLIIANVPSVKHRMTYKSGWFLPYGGFPLWNMTYSPNYEFALLYVNLSNFSVFVCYMVLTTIVVTIMVFLSYQCKILQNRVKTCLERSVKGKVLTWPLLHINLKDCIDQLTTIMKITQKFEKTFSFFLLADFVGLSIIIASCLLYSFAINSYNFKFAQMLTIVFAAVVSEFFTAYWGSELVKEYLEVGRYCYEIDFIGVDLRFQKSLRFMIQQTQTPIHFSVGGFSPLTMRTFLLVLKGAYSCFTFLHHRNKN